jgi:demethylmenaquinone methyltransferase/2-methoxy-6-polyprenyl-1,4-benzoquinol methylase
MSQFQMPDAKDKPAFVQENFNIIAKKYDLFNDLNSFLMHRYWKNTMVNQAYSYNPNANVILDLCSGTGDIAFRLVNRFPSAKVIYAIDFSENMLSFCKSRLANQSRAKVDLGDATNLSRFDNDSVDIVTVGFGLRNVGDLSKTLEEIFRILRPGGLFLNLDVGKVKNPFIRFFANFYFFQIVPLLGYLIWGSENKMFDYLPISSKSYPGQEELKTILQSKGFDDVSYHDFVFGNTTLHMAKKLSPKMV